MVPEPQPTWVATDIDGTFLAPDNSVGTGTEKLYLELIEKGVPVVPSTGRSLLCTKRILETASPKFCPKMKLTPGVYLHGTVVYGETEDDVLYAASIPGKACRAFLQAYYTMREQGRLGPCTLWVQHAYGSLIDFETPIFWSECHRWLREIPGAIANKPLLDLLEERETAEVPYSQINLIGEPEDLDKFEVALKLNDSLDSLLREAGISFVRNCEAALAILPTGEHKAHGLKMLCQKLPHLRFDEVMTIGDGENDLEMLSGAPFSVAMGQASDKVKSAAKLVTASHSQGGWEKAVSAYLKTQIC
eukprot:Protomagalhaensia_wolfi_Nauph_80__2195@NODE_2418_length_1097_cov_372_793951_g1893_i0_p1_GENE_NODE_2418_length_1097_cov_372_793951_g1893_i0NODE_2418_length_1097_cov_372_793951_g1893_i0_p1_ORF_typecomplete_len304_score43_42Hydrolase_3/PF08282_12/2_9e41S6PP/PF05116_13/16S6PP/PF05116_13/2_5e03S6PP/PF05116_13/1_5e07HAD/PF12710_7/6_6e03HAD/PF12710_7/0_011Trehalose_PPase/PF02358_16/0_098_NODE_2418_length_1097_cov_372_793951_g1893_i081992